jgi:1-deoxy-D-xylulose-5-phosphate synthase
VGIQKSTAIPKTTFTQVFGHWLNDMADHDPRLIGITPAMREGSGMVEFERRFPTRYFDVGIAEQHAVTFAAGIACEGQKPVVAIYSTFLQRGYDQLIHDVALQNLDVTFALDRAGLVGADGATHAGNYDIAFLRCIPNMVVATPSDENECRLLLSTCYQYPGPASVRYPRGAGCGAVVQPVLDVVPVGRGIVRRRGSNIAILVFGTLLPAAMQVADALDLTVADMRFVKPLDQDLVREMAATHAAIVTVEEGAVMGGAGSAVTEALNQSGLVCPVLQLGLPDLFIDHGDQAALLAGVGLNAAGIERAIRQRFDV